MLYDLQAWGAPSKMMRLTVSSSQQLKECSASGDHILQDWQPGSSSLQSRASVLLHPSQLALDFLLHTARLRGLPFRFFKLEA